MYSACAARHFYRHVRTWHRPTQSIARGFNCGPWHAGWCHCCCGTDGNKTRRRLGTQTRGGLCFWNLRFSAFDRYNYNLRRFYADIFFARQRWRICRQPVYRYQPGADAFMGCIGNGSACIGLRMGSPEKNCRRQRIYNSVLPKIPQPAYMVAGAPFNGNCRNHRHFLRLALFKQIHQQRVLSSFRTPGTFNRT